MILDIKTSNRELQHQIVTVTEWFFNRMKLTRFKNLEIEFLFTKSLAERTNGLAFTTWTDDPFNPRCFEIEFDRDHAREGGQAFVSTIIHELVHVKQFLRRELKELPIANMSLWKGCIVNTDDVEYFDQPWELEAYSLEETLTEEFMEQTDVWF